MNFVRLHGLCILYRHYHFQEEELQYAEIDLPESDKLPPTKDTILYAEMNEEQPIARKDIE